VIQLGAKIKDNKNKLDQIRNQTDGESIIDIERLSRMMEMNSPNYSLVGSGFGFNPQENLLNRNENVPAQQVRSPSIGSSVLMDELAKVLAKTPENLAGDLNSNTRPESTFDEAGGIISDDDKRRQRFLENVEYNMRQQEISAMRDPKTDYMQQDYYSPPRMLEYLQKNMISEIQGKLDTGKPLTQKEIRILENYGPGYDYSKKLASLKEIDTGVIPERMTIEDMSSISKTLPTGEIPSIDSLMQYKSPLSFGDNYNIENPLNMDSNRFYETTINKDPKDLAPIIGLALNAKTPKDKVAEDMMKRPQGPDYSAAKSILDELQAVDYSAFKPDYAGLITEQERRAQKIRDDASKDASAQALIQLGAGLAAGDISKGLSAAGQSVADIKRQARAEARDEEGFARQLRLAQDEAGMQLGLKQAEAEISIQLERAGLSKGEADALANAKVRAFEFEQEFDLKTEELAAMIRRDIMTSGKSSLSALIEQWKDLADAATEEDIAERNNLANQIKVLVEEQKFLRDELRGSLNADSSPNTVATAPKQNEKKDTDVIEAARSLLGNR
jgi:hypothetical protein